MLAEGVSYKEGSYFAKVAQGLECTSELHSGSVFVCFPFLLFKVSISYSPHTVRIWLSHCLSADY